MKTKIKQIILEEINNVSSEFNISPLDKYILAEQLPGTFGNRVSEPEAKVSSAKKDKKPSKQKKELTRAQKARKFGNAANALLPLRNKSNAEYIKFIKLAKKFIQFEDDPQRKKSAMTSIKAAVRNLRRSKSGRQAILLMRINKDRSGKSKGSNVTIKDLQTALASIPDKRVQRFAKAATPGKYDRNTYRAIVSFQRKYRNELQDKRLDGLVGPSTIGVLEKYDTSGTFGKKLGTKGTTIAAKDATLKGFDKIIAAKPGKDRQRAMVKLAISQPEAYMSQLRKLEKELRTKPGIAKISEQENVIEPEDLNYDAKVRNQKTAPAGSSNLSDTELSRSKKVAVYKDMKSALLQAARYAKKNKDKEPKVFQALIAAAKKTKQVGIAKFLDPNFISDAETKAAMSEKKVTELVNALEKEMDSNFGSGNSEKILKQLENSKANYEGKLVPALGAAYFIFGRRRGQTLLQWIRDERALKTYWSAATLEAMKAVKNAPPVPAAGEKAAPTIGGMTGTQIGTALAAEKAKTLKAASVKADKSAASKPVNVKQDLNFSIKNFFNDASKGYDKRAQEVALKKVAATDRKKVSQIFALLNKMGGAGVKLRWDGKSIILTVGGHLKFAISADEANYIHGGQKSVAAAKAAKAKQKQPAK